MTRKDYIKFANVIKRNIENVRENSGHNVSCIEEGAIVNLALDMCDIFKEDNRNFDKQRFLDAITV